MTNALQKAILSGLLMAFLLYWTGDCTAEPSLSDSLPEDLRAMVQEVPERQKLPFTLAIIASIASDYNAIIAEIEPLSKDPTVHLYLLALLGYAYDQTNQSHNAAEIYALAVTKPKGLNDLLTENLEWMYGQALLKSGQALASIEHLRAALKGLDYPANQGILDDLIAAYQIVDAGAAFALSLKLICDNPLSQHRWSKIQAMAKKSYSLPAPHSADQAIEAWCPAEVIVTLGPPWQWGKEEERIGVPAFFRAADQLFYSGQRDLAIAYLVAVSPDLIQRVKKGIATIDGTVYLSLLEQPYRSQLSKIAQNALEIEIYNWHFDHERMSHAVGMLQQACKSASQLYLEKQDRGKLDECNKKIDFTSRILFARVSFDLTTGHPRSNSEEEFIGTGIEKVSDEIADHYGRVSFTEDWANMYASFWTNRTRYKGRITTFKEVLDKCFEVQSMEIPVKLFLMDLETDPAYEERLDLAIRQIGPNRVREATWEAYVLKRRLNDIRRDLVGIKPNP